MANISLPKSIKPIEIVLVVIMIIIMMRGCTTASNISKMEKQMQSMDSVLKSTTPVTKQEIDGVVSQRLYDFLIFEDDLDKKKTSLSDIKIKIQKNEK